MMHYHKCKEPTSNAQVCGQIIAAVAGTSCAECSDDHRCSLHHADPKFRVEPTPPAKK
jgi:hypothetical protein